MVAGQTWRALCARCLQGCRAGSDSSSPGFVLPAACRTTCTDHEGCIDRANKGRVTDLTSALPQAQAWMEWEMAVGFRRASQLQVWDGRRWSQEDMPGGRRTSPPRGRPRGAASSTAHTNGVSPATQSNGAAAPGGNGASPASSAGGRGSGDPAASQRASGDAHSPAAASEGTARKPWEAFRSASRPVAGATAATAAVVATGGGTAPAASSASGGGSPSADSAAAEVPAMVAQPLLECHYSLHGAFLEQPLLEVCAAAAERRPCFQTFQPMSLEASSHLPLRRMQLAHCCYFHARCSTACCPRMAAFWTEQHTCRPYTSRSPHQWVRRSSRPACLRFCLNR